MSPTCAEITVMETSLIKCSGYKVVHWPTGTWGSRKLRDLALGTKREGGEGTGRDTKSKQAMEVGIRQTLM